MNGARLFARATLLLSLGTVFVHCDIGQPVEGSAKGSERPNIILIVIDTARADHFSSYGYPRRTTPNIDALARVGVLYRNARSVAPWTLPAHMSMFTGLLPGEHGATWRAFSEPKDASLSELTQRTFSVAEPERLLGRQLEVAGYDSLGFSSNPWVGPRTGMAEGFAAFFEVWRSWPDYREQYARLPDSVKTDPRFDQGRTGRALLLFKTRFLENAVSEPFFAFFNLMELHYPYDAPEPYRYRFGGDPEVRERMFSSNGDADEIAMLSGRKLFSGEELLPFYDEALSFVDFMIGNLFRWLQERNLFHDALIIVTSDHGEHLGENGFFSHQLSVSEELLRVPLLIKYPGNAHAGVVVDNTMVSNLDVYRTILAAAGRPAPVPRAHAPTSSADLARIEDFERDALLAEYFYSDAYLHQMAAANPDFKVTPNQVVRRALFSDGRRSELEDWKIISEASLEAPGVAAPTAAQTERRLSQLREYARRNEAVRVRRSSAPDAEALEALRALGYVDDAVSHE